MKSIQTKFQQRFKVAVGGLLLAVSSAVFAQEAALARVPLVPPDTKDPIVGPIFDGIRSRGGQPLHMHRAVAQSPKIFKAYADMALALRTAATTPRADRELMILRAAQLSGGDYEFAQHRPMAVSCGISEVQIAGL